jgi:transposase
MIQLAWRFLMFQKDSALALWYRARTTDSRSGTRKAMIVALARKLIIGTATFEQAVARDPVFPQNSRSPVNVTVSTPLSPYGLCLHPGIVGRGAPINDAQLLR